MTIFTDLFSVVGLFMSEAHRLASVVPQETRMPNAGFAIPVGESRQSAWRGLLRPSTVETGVLIADVFLIVITGIICSLAYYWMMGGETKDVAPYVGVSFIIAANFSAIMTARQNYRLLRVLGDRQSS